MGFRVCAFVRVDLKGSVRFTLRSSFRDTVQPRGLRVCKGVGGWSFVLFGFRGLGVQGFRGAAL